MDISERIAFIIKMHNLNNSSFADRLEVQRSNISHILSGRSKPGLEFLEKVLIRFPRVNAEWLITGRSEVKNNSKADESPSTDSVNKELRPDVQKISARTIAMEKEIDYVLVVYKDQSFIKLSHSQVINDK